MQGTVLIVGGKTRKQAEGSGTDPIVDRIEQTLKSQKKTKKVLQLLERYRMPDLEKKKVISALLGMISG